MKWFPAVLAAFAVGIFACSTDRQEKVAEVNGETITPREFTERYKQYLSETNGRDNILMRKQILNNMINEKLIAADVRRRGLDKDSLARTRLEEIRTQAVLLGYARRITLDTMAVTERELNEEFERYTTRVAARYVYAPTEEEAWNLKDALELGGTFDEIARTTFEDPGLATNGGYLGYFGWGEMEPALEEAAYTLPIGRLSDPLKFRIGYAILKVERRVRQPISTESDFARVKDKLSGAIEKRKVVNILTMSAAKMRSGLSPVFHEDVLPPCRMSLG
jgi:parvulin-like peptidyl-prolyl isomerase